MSFPDSINFFAAIRATAVPEPVFEDSKTAALDEQGFAAGTIRVTTFLAEEISYIYIVQALTDRNFPCRF